MSRTSADHTFTVTGPAGSLTATSRREALDKAKAISGGRRRPVVVERDDERKRWTFHRGKVQQYTYETRRRR